MGSPDKKDGAKAWKRGQRGHSRTGKRLRTQSSRVATQAIGPQGPQLSHTQLHRAGPSGLKGPGTGI